MRAYIPFAGFQLDGNFLTHVGHCPACRQYDVAQPATLALLCLDGAVLWKREHEADPGKAPGPRDNFIVSAAVARRAMRYRE